MTMTVSSSLLYRLMIFKKENIPTITDKLEYGRRLGWNQLAGMAKKERGVRRQSDSNRSTKSFALVDLTITQHELFW